MLEKNIADVILSVKVDGVLLDVTNCAVNVSVKSGEFCVKPVDGKCKYGGFFRLVKIVAIGKNSLHILEVGDDRGDFNVGQVTRDDLIVGASPFKMFVCMVQKTPDTIADVVGKAKHLVGFVIETVSGHL